MQLITGNTYPVKDRLKALGGRWNGRDRGWEVPDAEAELARSIVAEVTPANYVPRGGRVSNYFRFSSGEVMYRNKRGRCEDAPCCGCCT